MWNKLRVRSKARLGLMPGFSVEGSRDTKEFLGQGGSKGTSLEDPQDVWGTMKECPGTQEPKPHQVPVAACSFCAWVFQPTRRPGGERLSVSLSLSLSHSHSPNVYYIYMYVYIYIYTSEVTLD